MIFIALLFSWLVMNFGGFARALQYDDWFDDWRDSVASLLAVSGNLLAFAVIVLLPVLLLGLLLSWFGGWLFGLVGLALNLAVMLYACGRYAVADDLRMVRNALHSRDPGQLQDLAAMRFNIAGDDTPERLNGIYRALAYRSYENWFAPAFWFLLLGAPGALFYRLLHVCEESAARGTNVDDDTIADIRQYANTMVGWFDFIPARIWALLQALVSDFSRVFAVVQAHVVELTSAACFLFFVQDAAVDAEAEVSAGIEAEAGDTPHAESALDRVNGIEQLFERTMIAGLIFVAVVYIAF